jgi:hypothetical protein
MSKKRVASLVMAAYFLNIFPTHAHSVLQNEPSSDQALSKSSLPCYVPQSFKSHYVFHTKKTHANCAIIKNNPRQLGIWFNSQKQEENNKSVFSSAVQDSAGMAEPSEALVVQNNRSISGFLNPQGLVDLNSHWLKCFIFILAAQLLEAATTASSEMDECGLSAHTQEQFKTEFYTSGATVSQIFTVPRITVNSANEVQIDFGPRNLTMDQFKVQDQNRNFVALSSSPGSECGVFQTRFGGLSHFQYTSGDKASQVELIDLAKQHIAEALLKYLTSHTKRFTHLYKEAIFGFIPLEPDATERFKKIFVAPMGKIGISLTEFLGKPSEFKFRFVGMYADNHTTFSLHHQKDYVMFDPVPGNQLGQLAINATHFLKELYQEPLDDVASASESGSCANTTSIYYMGAAAAGCIAIGVGIAFCWRWIQNKFFPVNERSWSDGSIRHAQNATQRSIMATASSNLGAHTENPLLYPTGNAPARPCCGSDDGYQEFESCSNPRG